MSDPEGWDLPPTAENEKRPAIVVTGSRDWTDAEAIDFVLVRLALYLGMDKPVLHHGGARGADTIAANRGKAKRWPVVAHLARWDAEGKAAGPRRNRRMLKAAKATASKLVVVAFHLNNSPGTADCIKAAQELGIPVYVTTGERTLKKLPQK